jgi:hypothetical protein
VTTQSAELKRVSADRRYTDELISVNDLSVDPQIQRFRFNPRKVEAIVKDFNDEALGLVTVSRRNAVTLVIVDGWHRWEAVRRRTDAQGEIYCRVFDGLSLAEEAQMFLDLNPGNQPNALDRYRMRLLTEDETIKRIDAAVHMYGWTVHPQPATSHIQAVQTLERIQKVADRNEAFTDLLSETLRVITKAWGHAREATAAAIMEGLASVIVEYRPKGRLDMDRLISQLSEYPGGPATLASDANQVARLQKMRPVMAVAGQIVGQYNKGLRTGGPSELPPWRRNR